MDKDNSKTFLLVLLGLLTAFGPFVTDMYLPALPAMADDFGTSSSMVQLGLTTSMIGLACGQLFFGPLSDKYGRRTPLLTAMWLFLGSTVFCIFAADIEQFVFLRFVQGIAGSGGIVISRSVATDKFSGRELAKMLALIGAINGIAPVAAPIVGGTLTGIIGWRGIFTILLGLGIVLLAGSFRFSESLPAANRSTVEWADILRGFKTTLRNRRYLCYIFQLGFAQGILFANIASSPFIVQQHYGFTPFQFSICFAVNAVAIGGRSRTLGQVPPPRKRHQHRLCGDDLLRRGRSHSPRRGLQLLGLRVADVRAPVRHGANLHDFDGTGDGKCPGECGDGVGTAGRRMLRLRRDRLAAGRDRRHTPLNGHRVRRLRRLLMALHTPRDAPRPATARGCLTTERAGSHAWEPARYLSRTTNHLRTLTMILRTSPSPIIGAWPSSGKRIVNCPGRSV